jgi:isoleucyl-tRNA synthetase
MIAPDLTADALETEVAARWTRDGVFAAAQAAHADGEPWVFYEGPPTANGRPGIHHVFSRTLKDLFCRHRAMLGYHVPRKAGWDTHGLPVLVINSRSRRSGMMPTAPASVSRGRSAAADGARFSFGLHRPP